MRQEALKRPSYFQDVLYHHDYAENVVAIVTHQIQYEYYSGNRSVSIEGTALEKFSTTDQETSSSSFYSCKNHDMFHYYIFG